MLAPPMWQHGWDPVCSTDVYQDIAKGSKRELVWDLVRYLDAGRCFTL